MDDNYRYPADEKKVKIKSNGNSGSKKESKSWIFFITILSFFLSASLLLLSTKILEQVHNLVAILVVIGIIFFGVVFDTIGISATAADEAPFHSMASRKVYGAKQAIMLVRNANKVSAFCNDVVGDICGVISGTASAFIIYRLSNGAIGAETSLMGLAISGMVASLTVGGKALGKTIAIENSNYIVYKVAVILKFFGGRINLKDNKKRKKKNEG